MIAKRLDQLGEIIGHFLVVGVAFAFAGVAMVGFVVAAATGFSEVATWLRTGRWVGSRAIYFLLPYLSPDSWLMSPKDWQGLQALVTWYLWLPLWQAGILTFGIGFSVALAIIKLAAKRDNDYYGC